MLPNVNLIKFLDEGPKKGKIENWIPVNESIVLIQKGELICGYLNKATAGSSSLGLVHVIWKECGPEGAKDFLSTA